MYEYGPVPPAIDIVKLPLETPSGEPHMLMIAVRDDGSMISTIQDSVTNGIASASGFANSVELKGFRTNGGELTGEVLPGMPIASKQISKSTVPSARSRPNPPGSPQIYRRSFGPGAFHAPPLKTSFCKVTRSRTKGSQLISRLNVVMLVKFSTCTGMQIWSPSITWPQSKLTIIVSWDFPAVKKRRNVRAVVSNRFSRIGGVIISHIRRAKICENF
jgi:hypothetical protein